jgi:NADH-quinone oxidoreductase subunit L
MGGIKPHMPITYRAMLISTLAISGVPLFSGFLSKDFILAGTLALVGRFPQHSLLVILGFGAALLTAFYMFRMIFLTFHNEPKRPELVPDIKESPTEMLIPLVILGTLSFYIFYTLPNWNPLSETGWFTHLVPARDSIVPGHVNLSAHEIEEGVHHSHFATMIISIIVAGTGILLAWLMYLRKTLSAEMWSRKLKPFYTLSLNKFFVDEIYGKVLYRPFMKLAKAVAFLDWDLYDKYIVNGVGRLTERLSKFSGYTDYDGLDQGIVDGIGRFAQRSGLVLRKIQTGRIQNYILFAALGLIVLIILQVI